MKIYHRRFNLGLNSLGRTARNRSGFTFVEILVVMVILGVLATMAVTSISDFKNKTKTGRAVAEVRGYEKDIVAYFTEKGNLPANLTVPGMENLRDAKDPWGNSYVYTRTLNRTFGPLVNSDYELYSWGVDGLTADSITDVTSEDDIIRANDGAFVGTAKFYAL